MSELNLRGNVVDAQQAGVLRFFGPARVGLYAGCVRSMNREMVSELVRYRGLLGMLAWRDIRVRYKQSIMGVAWAFLLPLIQTLVLYSIFSFGMRGMGASIKDNIEPVGMPYFLFVLSGMIPWTFFAGGVCMSIESLTRNSRLVTKIYFPREVFPLGSVMASLVDLAIAMWVFIPFYVYFVSAGKVTFSATLLLLPAVLLIQVLFVSGLALILSMANLFFRDVKYIMTFVLQLWFFATNVMYPIKFESYPALKFIVYANPMIPILEAYRYLIMGQMPQNVVGLSIAAVIAAVTFVVGWRVFHRAEFKFAEYL